MIKNLIITITESSEQDGFYYDIYDCETMDVNDGRDSLDGGFCTTTIQNALEMATKQAKEIIKNTNTK